MTMQKIIFIELDELLKYIDMPEVGDIISIHDWEYRTDTIYQLNSYCPKNNGFMASEFVLH